MMRNGWDLAQEFAERGRGMQSFKDVMSREEERRNLRNVSISVFAVLLLVGLAFGAM